MSTSRSLTLIGALGCGLLYFLITSLAEDTPVKSLLLSATAIFGVLSLIRAIWRTPLDKHIEQMNESTDREKWLKRRGYKEVTNFSVTRRAVNHGYKQHAIDDYECTIVCQDKTKIYQWPTVFYESEVKIQNYEQFVLVFHSHFVIWYDKTSTGYRLFASL